MLTRRLAEAWLCVSVVFAQRMAFTWSLFFFFPASSENTAGEESIEYPSFIGVVVSALQLRLALYAASFTYRFDVGFLSSVRQFPHA